ncbi:MAG: pyruvate, phosphate dikinase [Actinomycetes bacterium]
MQHETSTGARWVSPLSAGSRDMADLLGGKGAGLAEMTRLGLPVPGGFTITTEACREFMRTGTEPAELLSEVDDELEALERQMGRRFGSPEDPLLLAVRSGAKFSMPGMMDTILDVGLNDETVQGLARRSGERFAWDCYRRFTQMFGRTVMGVDGARFEQLLTDARRRAGVDGDQELSAETLRALVGDFRRILVDTTGEDLPQDPKVQLRHAIRAVFASWNSPRARLYRSREGISDDLGTAVNVLAMVFGNTGPRSGSGVCFTRDPATGEPGVYGEYLQNAQGEDVVAGIRNTVPLRALHRLDPAVYTELLDHLATLESHYRDLCDVEFTVEDGRLWVLQTRVGKRTPAAAFRIACQLVDEGRIDLDEALSRVTGEQLETLLHPRFGSASGRALLARGLPASPGAAVGQVALDAETAVRWAAEGRRVVLVRPETSPDDLAGMVASTAVVTARGGVTSHAAVVARGMGRTCVAGAGDLVLDADRRTVTGLAGVVVAEGDVVSVDGTSGEVFVGELPVEPSGVAAALSGSVEQPDPLSDAVLRLLRHADDRAAVRVRANADTPADAGLARQPGARGIGLCRTEHMLLGERRAVVESIVLDEDREQALAELQRLHREDLTEMLRAMDGLPVVVRLLDPPLHEFLPDLTELTLEVAHLEASGSVPERTRRQLAAVQRWHEQNPMLGLRGVRLAVVVPEILDAQVKALAQAVLDLREQGLDPRAELMVPLVVDAAELALVRSRICAALQEVAAGRGVPAPDVREGTMIELPRAALTADRLAQQAEFFSFGTNDLTQTTWGLSRDDAEAAFLPAYRDAGLLRSDPFARLDVAGVGRLVEIAVREGRAARPDLEVGVCGEHGGDPESVRFFCETGVDYVSCSPWRVPVARLETGRVEAMRAGAGVGADSR